MTKKEKYITADELKQRWEELQEMFKVSKREVILSLVKEVKVYLGGYIEIIPH